MNELMTTEVSMMKKRKPLLSVVLLLGGMIHLAGTGVAWGAPHWHAETVDGSVARPSITLDSIGAPHVSYYGSAYGHLKYARLSGGVWELVVVDSAVGYDDWVETCIALSAQGYPHISYYDFSNNTRHDLKYAYFDGSWHQVTIDQGLPGGYCGSRNSIVLDNSGTPHMSYSEDTGNNVKHGYYDWTPHWTTVATDGSDNPPNSIAIDSIGDLHIAYSRNVSPGLGYAYYDGSWHVDGVAFGGGEPSVAVDSLQHAHIAHRSGFALVYTYYDGAAWHSDTIFSDAGPAVGKWPSIALDCLEHPHISFFDATDNDLKYARYDGASWFVETVDSTGRVGGYSSLAVDRMGIPNIVYADFDNDELKYAYLIPWGPVSSFTPEPNQTHVPPDVFPTVAFDTDMNPATINENTFLVESRSGGPSSGTVVYDDVEDTATFYPDKDFEAGDLVMVVLTAAIETAEGQSLSPGCVWSFTISTEDGLGMFHHVSEWLAGNGPSAVLAADLDGDSLLDLAVPSYYDSTVTVLVNLGDGAFGDPRVCFANSGPNSVCAADFNVDGFVDLAMPNLDENRVTILENDGGGGFSIRSSALVGGAPAAVVCGELTGNGSVDLAVANSGTHNVSILEGQNNGTFAGMEDYPVDEGPWSLIAADLDNDRDLDLAVACQGSNRVSLLLNDGTGSFAVHEGQTVGTMPTAVIAADLDGDNYVDLATANQVSNDVSVLLNSGYGCGSPTFIETTYTVGSAPQSVSAGDFDSDGDLDLVSVNHNADSITVLRNDGAGRFVFDTTWAVGIGPTSVFSADLDDDGDLDLAVANHLSNDVSVLLNGVSTGLQGVSDLPAASDALIVRNRPNPFNPLTELWYEVPVLGQVTLSIHDVGGRLVAALVDAPMPAGSHTALWDGRDSTGRLAASGVYFARLKAGGEVVTRKITLVR